MGIAVEKGKLFRCSCIFGWIKQKFMCK